MQLFGVLSILLTFVAIFWWFSLSANPSTATDDATTDKPNQYIKAIESAEHAADLLSQ